MILSLKTDTNRNDVNIKTTPLALSIVKGMLKINLLISRCDIKKKSK